MADVVNNWCCQPDYCRVNAPGDYANPDACLDCQRERAMQMSDAAALINHFRAAPEPPDDATVEAVVDLISDAMPGGKKVLLEAVGKAMVRAEVERQAKRRPR